MFIGHFAVGFASKRLPGPRSRPSWPHRSCLASYGASLVSPPPPSVTALGWTAIGGSIITLWLAWWTDRHRTEREQRAQSRGLA